MILPGVTIGDGAKVAAYSLVNRNVKPGEFVGGIPIKTLKKA
jgi:acetyltransferase-like isoleucine patch superfamily enzyme